MPSFGVKPVKPHDLLLRLQGQLREGGIPPKSNIKGAGLGDLAFLSLWPDDILAKLPRGKQFVAIRPNRFPLWQSVIMGAGVPLTVTQTYDAPQTGTGFNAVVTLVCGTQINPDPETTNVQAITEETVGAISFVLRVFKAVQFWCPCDDVALTNCHLREPARITDGGFGLQPRKIGDAWWVLSNLDLEIKFTAEF